MATKPTSSWNRRMANDDDSDGNGPPEYIVVGDQMVRYDGRSERKGRFDRYAHEFDEDACRQAEDSYERGLFGDR